MIFTFGLVLLSFVGVYAQYGLHFGVGAGFTASNLKTGFSSIGSDALGGQAQIYVGYGFNRKISLESGITYNFNRIRNLESGQIFMSPYVINDAIYTVKRQSTNLAFHTIEIPLLFFYHTNIVDIFLGGSFDYTIVINAYSVYYAFNVNKDKTFPKRVQENATGNFEPYDASVHLGIQKSFGDISLNIEAKAGVLEISKLQALSLNNGYNYSMRTFSIVLGAKYSLSSLFGGTE